MQNRFLVFKSKTHQFLRGCLMFLTFFLFYLSCQLGYVWLYGVSVLFLIIVLISLSFLYAFITVTDRGLSLQYGFWKNYQLNWEDILCCGVFSLKISGAVKQEDYIYFSKTPIEYHSLITGNTLPAPSSTFLYLTKQKTFLITLEKYAAKHKKLEHIG